MRVMRKAAAIVLTLALAMPAIVGTSAEAKKAKAPSMLITSTEVIADSSTQLFIESNGAKIVSTTWKTSKKNVAKISKKKKLSATINAGSAGDTSAKITATVKYKIGKKVKTKKLTCKVKVLWLEVTEAQAITCIGNGHTELVLTMNGMSENINKYDKYADEGETVVEGYWTTGASNVVEVTDAAASGAAVAVEQVEAYGTDPILHIDLGKEITEKTTYNVTLKGYKGCGSKMMVQTEVKVEPTKVTVTADGFANPEKKGNISIFLSAAGKTFDMGMIDYFGLNKELMKKSITVKDAAGKEMTVTDVVPTSYQSEGDHLIVNLEGGADSKSFTVEITSAFLAAYLDGISGPVSPAEKTIKVDKEIDLSTATTPAA